ncbi:MAG: transcriptional repressor LexA [Bryobacterales bacterium]|nr:transcriptional repressor LexA [Bryobacterales bacterium]
MALTRRQKQVLDFIAAYQAENGYSPSYEEIAAGLGLASLATVHKHIAALERKHYLRRGFNQSRSLELTPKFFQEQRRLRRESASPEIPLLGRIAAGAPIESVAGTEKLELGGLLGREDVYALQVRGDSMIEDHICDGDLVLVERTAEVRDGDIVVALVRGSETTLKRFYREEGGVARLQPANATMPPLRVSLAELEIQGRVLAVLRKYR